VTAKAVGGDSGVPPIVVPDGQRQVVLGDRVLTVSNVNEQLSGNATAIRVNVVVRNTGKRPLPDQTTRFQVMTPEGDAFQARATNAKVRRGAIASGASRAATLVFDLPAAAAANVRLVYRPAADTPTVLMPLHAR
jgi:hypothetical protein